MPDLLQATLALQSSGIIVILAGAFNDGNLQLLPERLLPWGIIRRIKRLSAILIETAT
jgi:hypothetical protein